MLDEGMGKPRICDYQISQSQPYLINSSSVGCVGSGSEVGSERRERARTLEFVFAYIDGGRGVDYVGGEEVDHCGRSCKKLGERED